MVNIKIAGKWMFIPLKMVLIGIDPYPFSWIITLAINAIRTTRPSAVLAVLRARAVPLQLGSAPPGEHGVLAAASHFKGGINTA